MNPLSENQQIRTDTPSYRLGCFLGRSRVGRFLLALACVVTFSSLAYTAWRDQQFTASVVAFALIYYGLQLAWRFLPFDAATRARWSREHKLAEKCPIWPYYQIFYFGGVAVAATELSRIMSHESYYLSDFLWPAVFIVFGVLTYCECRRFARNHLPN